MRRRLHSPLLANEYFPQNIPMRSTLGFGSMTRENQPDRSAAAVVGMLHYYNNNSNENSVSMKGNRTDCIIFCVYIIIDCRR